MVSKKSRWLVIASGCFVGVLGTLAMGGAFFIFTLVQIIGALLASRFKSLGLGLMCAGSLLVSFWVFFFAGLFLFHPDTTALGATFLLAISTLLMIVSDVTLVKEYLKVWKMRKAVNP